MISWNYYQTHYTEDINMKLLCEKCFKQRCNHDADKFECDDLLVDAVRKLNKMGYKTIFSCSGHHYRPEFDELQDGNCYLLQTYIVLDEVYDVPLLSHDIDFKLSDLERITCNGYELQRKLTIENVQWFHIDDKKGQDKFINDNINAINFWVKQVIKHNEILSN